MFPFRSIILASVTRGKHNLSGKRHCRRCFHCPRQNRSSVLFLSALVMSYPRNQPCICGSGKKYKHCHLGKLFHPETDISVQHRSRITLAAAIEIFGFSKSRSWTDFKQNISGQQIRRFYEVQVEMWRPETDWAAIMPAPDSKLRGLYLGDIRPDSRFETSSDSVFIRISCL